MDWGAVSGEPTSPFADAQACWRCRVSAKLFQCSPAKLPADIKHNMVRLLGCGSNRAEGYIRPGCVHFTITATTSHAQARSIKVQPSRDDD